jgi:hypothetical protein
MQRNCVTRGTLLQLSKSCYTVAAYPAIIRVLISNSVHVANVRTCKRKTERGTTSKETYMETAKDVSVKAFNLRKSPAKYSVNFMALQIFCRRLKYESVNKFYTELFHNSF